MDKIVSLRFFQIVLTIERFVNTYKFCACYRRSIACSRRGSHGIAVMRFWQNRIIPTFLPNEKAALDTRFLHFWWKCEGICSKRSLRNSKRANLFAKRSVSPKYGVHVAKQRHDEIVQSPHDRHKKQVERGFNLSFLWWKCGDLNPGPPDRTRHFLHV